MAALPPRQLSCYILAMKPFAVVILFLSLFAVPAFAGHPKFKRPKLTHAQKVYIKKHHVKQYKAPPKVHRVKH